VDFITVVTGLPRSGTSLMMQILAAGGIPPLTDNVRGPDESNPRGYFEFEPVKRLRSDQSWVKQARGHAVKIVHLLIRELPIDSRLQYRVILMSRNMREILASQRVMLERQGKKSADETLLAQVYQAQLGELERWLHQREQFATLKIDYADLIRTPRVAAVKIDEFLSCDLNVDEMTKAIDPGLYRQRESPFT
jgi:hypothetical protein